MACTPHKHKLEQRLRSHYEANNQGLQEVFNKNNKLPAVISVRGRSCHKLDTHSALPTMDALQPISHLSAISNFVPSRWVMLDDAKTHKHRGAKIRVLQPRKNLRVQGDRIHFPALRHSAVLCTSSGTRSSSSVLLCVS
eukprot:TRINITY_DN16053_c0_g1_i2.p2 TRINITY_DN16053_c0_g1~~TRINITY_DN16053_c0_g1_i2.p2  ORF type:complete len:139 (-),score=3.86 TRINITY_DN16053_c0_g1_i2:227-643(-)